MITTVSGKPLSKIGIGTFGIGGRGHRDVRLTEQADDDTYVRALTHTFNSGSNFLEVSLGYGHGNALRLIKQGLDASNLKREDIFITHSLYPRDLNSFDDIVADTDTFYQALGTSYADSTLVTQTLLLQYGEAKVFAWLHALLESGRSRYVSLSNASPSWIRKFKTEFEELFFAHEGHLSFEVRALQDKGVFTTCRELGVENIIWRPLRRSATLRNRYPLLEQLSTQYHRTPSQIILNWMVYEGFRPMVFSTNTVHINENLASSDFNMSSADYTTLHNLRLREDETQSIDWEGTSVDDDILRAVANS